MEPAAKRRAVRRRPGVRLAAPVPARVERVKAAAEHAGFEPRVAERSARVEALAQADEVREALVQTGNRRGAGEEDLAPVRSRLEPRERSLDVGEHARHGLGLRLPDEVDGDGVAPVLRTHPQPVGGDRADLGNLQHRLDALPQATQRPDRGHGVPARQQELGLQLLAAARREAHTEVRETVRPQARPPELGRAVHGVEIEDRVPVDRRGGRAEQLPAYPLRLAGHAALQPHLVDGVAPAREDADAVAARSDLVEVLVQGVPDKSLEHPLADVVGRLDLEGEARDGAECAEPDYESLEVGVPALGRHDVAAGRHESSPATAVARLPPASPEPWVAVATAPATEMCGSDAMLCSASRSRFSAAASSPYVMPAAKETVPAARSTTTSAGNPASVTSSVESAMSVNEWRDPSTRTRGAVATILRSSSSVDGRCRRSARYA